MPRFEFSQYDAEESFLRHQHDQLAKLLEEMDSEHGPVPADIKREVALWWPDADEAC